MVLELHVWGPAFGLPSVDAECLAAIAYLNEILVAEDWVVIAHHDPSSNPYSEFPALRHGSTWAGGFNSIVRYLQQLQSGRWWLDRPLSETQRSDSAALASFIESSGSILIAISLYTTYINYRGTTTRAFTDILPWDRNFVVPSARRAAARALTAHLGLASLDVEELDESPDVGANAGISGSYEAAKRAAGLPSDASEPRRASPAPLGRNHGITSLLNKREYTARFRLDALINDFLEPLSDVLGPKSYLLSDDQPSSLDCLALGYLGLMLYPPVTKAWLADMMTKRYPQLEKYTRRMRVRFLGREDVVAADVLALNQFHGDATAIERARGERGLELPWHPPQPRSPLGVSCSIVRDIAGMVPIISRAVLQRRVLRPATEAPSAAHAGSTFLLPSLLAASASLLAFVAGAGLYLPAARSKDDPLIFERPHRAPEILMPPVNEAGAMLAALGRQLELEEAFRR